ncbi:MAG: heterodisulfide reductase, partial [Pseudomonadota bacterium]|nr:heterodisulfide reductase [Pseudomonadota bacterium]
MVFVQCAGQRDETGKNLPYCSGHCCNTSIKQAMYFKDSNPDVDAVVVYTDLRTPGNGEDFYRSAQRKGVIFTKGKVSEVVPGAELQVKFKDLILNDDAVAKADLVVLATGMVANSGVDIDAAGGTPNVEGQDQAAAGDGKVVSILNLTYRQ